MLYLNFSEVGLETWNEKNHRDYFWKHEDGTLSEPLTMAERRSIPSDDGDDDTEDRQWAQYNRANDR